MRPQYGIVAEVKKQISRDAGQWEPHRKQLRKYDDALSGWWTPNERIDSSDAMLLLHQSRGRVFTKYLETEREREPSAVGSRSSVVEFNRADEGQPYIFFRREYGVISDPDLADRLEKGVSVPIAKVLRSFPNVRFYDAEPPNEELMTMLWMDCVASRYEPSRTGSIDRSNQITITVDEITEELQQAYGSRQLPTDERSREFPKAAWIRRALDTLVAVRLATTTGDGQTYTVEYRVFPSDEDLLERFCDLTGKSNAKKAQESQLDLQLGTTKRI
jgi:hypothetical protein